MAQQTPPGMGFKSFLQLGIESTWGTAVAATHKFELISENLTNSIGKILDPSLYNARSRRGRYQGGQIAKGQIKVRANYEGLMMLFDWAMGTATWGSVGGTSSAAPSPYIHTFVEHSYLNSYTLQISKGDMPVGTCFTFPGAKCTGITFAGKAGNGEDAMLTVTLDVISKPGLSSQTPTTNLVLAPIGPILCVQGTAASLKDASGDTATGLRIRSFEVKLASKCAEDSYYVGALSADEAIPNDFLDCSWTIEEEFLSKSLWDKAQAFTSGELALVFDNTANYNLTLHSGTAYVEDVSVPVSGAGIITQKVTYGADYNTSDASALKISNTNTHATIAGAYSA
jgi:hypothetical protein